MAAFNNLNPSRQQKKQQNTLIHTYGKIITSSVDSQLWLTRLPTNLATFWEEAPEGTHLGTLTFTKGTPVPKRGTKMKSGQKVIEQKLSLDVAEKFLQSNVCKDNPKLAETVKDLPLDYTITNLTTKIPVMYPFTRKEDGSIELHGTINRSCNLQMERNTKRYRSMCNTRMADAEEKHYVKSMDEQTEISLLTGLNKATGVITSGFGSSIADFGKKMNEAPPQFNNKRKFSETQSVRSILFTLFSQQTHWAMKELRGFISAGRTEKEIRTELAQIAEYHKTGEFKGFWELKTEFKGAAMNDGNNAGGQGANKLK